MCLDFHSETGAQKALKVQKKIIFSNTLLAGERNPRVDNGYKGKVF